MDKEKAKIALKHLIEYTYELRLIIQLKAAIKEIDIENYRDEELDFLYNFSKQVWVEKGEENPLYSKLANFRFKFLIL